MNTTERKVFLTTKRGFAPGSLMGQVERERTVPQAAQSRYPTCRAVSQSPYDEVAYYDEFGRLVDTKRIDWK